MKLEAGSQINEKLRLLRPLGEGGMGSVWLAEHAALEREVAVKFMAPELAESADAVERFTREAKACARMQSPHVVKIFDYAAPRDGLPYIVMERLEGEDLEERVSRSGPLAFSEAVDVVVQLGKALAEAHAAGIIHRDIKPENVYLTRSGDDLFVKMLDFGIAKQVGGSGIRVTITGTTVGTPIYMSPEQILSARDVDYRCDLWSLGVVAYFALTGHVPFEGPTFGAVCVSIDRGYETPASAHRQGLPRAVDAWFERALARSIDARFQSLHEMTGAFARAMQPEAHPAVAHPLSRSGELRTPRTFSGAMVLGPAFGSTRGRWTTALSALALVGLVAAGVDAGRRLTSPSVARAPSATAPATKGEAPAESAAILSAVTLGGAVAPGGLPAASPLARAVPVGAVSARVASAAAEAIPSVARVVGRTTLSADEVRGAGPWHEPASSAAARSAATSAAKSGPRARASEALLAEAPSASPPTLPTPPSASSRRGTLEGPAESADAAAPLAVPSANESDADDGAGRQLFRVDPADEAPASPASDTSLGL